MEATEQETRGGAERENRRARTRAALAGALPDTEEPQMGAMLQGELGGVFRFQNKYPALAGWLSCLECGPGLQNPSQRPYLGCGFELWSGCLQDASDWCFCLSLFLSLSPPSILLLPLFLSLPL